MLAWLTGILKGAASLLSGMRLTGRAFVRPAVTQQYPEERPHIHDRFRGRVDMPLDPVSGAHKCTMCMMCVKICPNASLIIKPGVNRAGKRVLDEFIYKLSTCTLCNLCVEVCPFDAIAMSHDYEMATYDRADLVMILNKPKGRAFDPSAEFLAVPPAAAPAAEPAQEAAHEPA
jgi:NADH-quinone oxidoreductase subunit I